MLEFEVYYDDGEDEGKSKVYAIDIINYQFLIVTRTGNFKWVFTECCKTVEEK